MWRQKLDEINIQHMGAPLARFMSWRKDRRIPYCHKIHYWKQELEGIFQLYSIHVNLNILWLILMTCQNIPWQKYIPTTSTIIHTSSLTHGFATWTSNNNVFVQLNVSTKIYPRLVPHVLKQKYVFGAFIKNHAPLFHTCLMWQNVIY
jgi:hypothetical protein